MKRRGKTSLIMIAALVAAGAILIQTPLPAFAGDKGFIFGRLNNKVMGDSWNGVGELVVVIGDDEKKTKQFKMCKNGYVAGEVDAGKVKLDVVKNDKEEDKEKREAFLNQPVLTVAAGQTTYWGNVKIGFDYGSLTFRSEDKLEEAKTAIQACLTELGETELAEKMAPAPVDKQFVFVGMDLR